jgi:hypothetical protein
MALTGDEKLALAKKQAADMNANITKMNAEISRLSDEISERASKGEPTLELRKQQQSLKNAASDEAKELMALEEYVISEVQPQRRREAAEKAAAEQAEKDANRPKVDPTPIYTGTDPVTGKERYYDANAHRYSLSDEKPSADTLENTKARLTYNGQDGVTGLHSYTVEGTGEKVYTPAKIKTEKDPVMVDDKPATEEEVKGEVEELPAEAATDPASAEQTAAEVNDAVTNQGAKSTVMPENGATRLVKPNYSTDDFKMKLRSKQTGFTIVFQVTPTIDESRSANYEHISPVHHPGTIQVYKNTEARQFNITVKLIARTAAEASLNVKYINAIRSWVMPYYGQGTASSSESNRLGAPPDILVFDVYGDKNISALPVVLTSYHWVYPDMVDYIPTEEGIPFPTIMDISLSLVESYSPEEYTSFDITEYRTGNMATAYTFSSLPSNTIPDADQASDDEADLRAMMEGFPEGYF